MDCEAYRILITGYIDRELSDVEIQQLKEHLQTCESCLLYLQQVETMQTALKRYTLFQDMPEVPSDFARKVTAQLQETLLKQPEPFASRLKRTGRHFVLNFVERWVQSLRTRPFVWTTSVSCVLVFIVGVVFVGIFQHSAPEKSIRFETEAPSPVIQVSQSAKTPEKKGGVSRMIVDSRANRELAEDENPLRVVKVAPDSMIRFEDTATISDEQVGEATSSSEGFSNQLSAPMELVEVAKEPFVRIAQTEAGPVEDYIYSHVTEVYQEMFVDDAVFVGYVQDAFIE